jgi:uncharacterized RDD family membrane protein YckC
LEQANPYSAPRSVVRGTQRSDTAQQLASPWVRLGAVVLDSLIPGIAGGILGFAAQMMGFPIEIFYGIVALVGIGYLIYQLMLLSQNGWTLGKKIVGIKIVRADGSKATVGRIFGLRMLVPGLIGAIPFVGIVFVLVDSLMIFTERRQTLHDRICDTIVIVA